VTIVNDACTIVQVSFTIVTYDRQNIFIIQATAWGRNFLQKNGFNLFRDSNLFLSWLSDKSYQNFSNVRI